MIITEKKCPTCGLVKPASEFYMRFPKKDIPIERLSDLSSYCRICQNAHNVARYHQDDAEKTSAWAGHLRRLYNITADDYHELLARQDGHCATCPATTPGDHIEHFCVDHDHSCCSGSKSCGECVRGLLCHGCNLGLGAFNDDIEIMLNAIAYLGSFAECPR